MPTALDDFHPAVRAWFERRFDALIRVQRETLDTNAWKLLWMPPALPHYELSGVFGGEPARTFTKSLIFSAWHVVPKAVSALLSYI